MRHDEPFDQPNTLMERTIALILNDGRTLPELYRDTGVPFYWIKNFVKRKFANPSVNRVQYLYEQLSGTKLFNN